MSAHFDRALLLVRQSRYELAEQELHQALAEDPNQATAHALLASCLAERDEFDLATREAQSAIHLNPTAAFGYYTLARIYHKRNRLEEAEQAIREAIGIDPHDADYLAMLAQLQLEGKQWPAALVTAEEGLAADPEHVACNNLRATALVKLGRREEAGATLAATLAREPENAHSHANLGWTLLHQNEPRKAMEHFREALRLDPQSEWARLGIIEALKARNLVYGLMLRYFLWLSKLSGRAQWGVVLGGYFGYRFLSSATDTNPSLQPWVFPIQVAYIIFVLMTWLAIPLFNLLLRLDRFGRLVLSREEKLAANLVGSLLTIALAALAWGIIANNELGLATALVCGFLTLPVSAIFQCDAGWPRRSMIGYTLLLSGLGLAAVGCIAANNMFGLTLFNGFMWGVFLNSFVANGLIMAQVKR
jgi:Tfp pilus assembly protein PilF